MKKALLTISVFFLLLSNLPHLCYAQFDRSYQNRSADIVWDSGNKVLTEEVAKLIKIQRFLRSYAWLKQFSGTAIIARNGQPLYKYATGFSNLNYKAPCALATKFNTCEITESFTAVAIMQLVEKGLLDLYAPVNTYLPEIPAEFGQTITIHQLLTHTTGLADYYETNDYIQDFLEIQNVNDLLRLIIKQPKKFPSGTQVEHSSSNYVLLAAIIEKMTGMTYNNYVQEKIIAPLQLEETQLPYWDEVVLHKAVGYKLDEDLAPTISGDFWGAYPFGADAIYASIEDLLKFENSFYTKPLVGKEYLDMIFTNYSDKSVPSQHDYDYGYGWKMKEVLGKKVRFQGGSLKGTSTQIRRYIDDGYTVIVYSNFHDDIAEYVADEIEQMLLDKDYYIPAHPLAYYFHQIATEKGIDYVTDDFDKILAGNQWDLEKVWTLYSLGNDYVDQGKVNEGLKIHQLNAKYFPNDPIVYEALGSTYNKLQRYEKSLEAFEKRLRILPGDKRATEMIKILKPKVNNSENSFSSLSNSSRDNLQDKVYETVETMPEFPGGQQALHNYLQQNMQYPKLTGTKIPANSMTVYVNFVIDELGHVTDANIRKESINTDKLLFEKEALRLVENMPNWKAGEENGRFVKVSYTLPVRFDKSMMTADE